MLGMWLGRFFYAFNELGEIVIINRQRFLQFLYGLRHFQIGLSQYLLFLRDSQPLVVLMLQFNLHLIRNITNLSNQLIIIIVIIIKMVNFVRNIYNKIIDKSIYAYKIVFSSRRKMLRWTFGLNLAMLLACFVIRRDQINGIVTSQVQEFSQVEIPRFLRKPLYGAYSKYYDLNFEEMELSFKDYQNFSAFFTRKINRKAAEEMPNTISSPCDGKILKISEITGDSCHIIKNSYYSLSQLVLGDSKLLKESQSIEQFLKIRKENKIYQVIIYLAPGDYHRFHSPVNMNILKIKSIDGKFQPVNENSLIKSKAIYEKNVRKVLFGKWSSGLLTMVMVGALNVSKIKIHDIKQLKRGEQLGYFNLGSTIVLLMEAKGIKEWHIKEGQKVQYGQSLLEFIL